MRILRAVYNKAVKRCLAVSFSFVRFIREGSHIVAPDEEPFGSYSGFDPSDHRFWHFQEICRTSYCVCGVAFVDMAYLKKRM